MESKEKSYRPFDGLSGEEGSIWTTSNEMSTSPMYITVDTTEAFPEMPTCKLENLPLIYPILFEMVYQLTAFFNGHLITLTL